MNTSNVKLASLGEVKIAKDGRGYYAASFQDPTNPFAKTVTRNFWQQKNAAGEPVWRGADPTQVKPFLNKTIPGYLATRKVQPYAITGSDNVERTADTYTTVILGNELDSQVFKALGHPLAEEAIVAAPVEALAHQEDIAIA